MKEITPVDMNREIAKHVVMVLNKKQRTEDAAKALGINIRTLRALIKEYGIEKKFVYKLKEDEI